MNQPLRIFALSLLALGATLTVRAADEAAPAPAAAPAEAAPAEASPLMKDLQGLIEAISAKVKTAAGEVAPNDLATEMAQFDAIIAKYPEAKPEERAGVRWAKALLFLQVFEDYEQGAAIVRSFKTDFPSTEFAAKADEILAAIEKDRQTAELRNSLAEGAVFPGISGKSTDGAAVSTEALKGKVVLVDFWATWCPPCREEIPHVLAAYEKYHAKGFEVLAVSLDQDEAALKKYVEEHKMPWPQIYEGASELAEKFGVESIPTTFLIDAQGKIAAVNLRGETHGKPGVKTLGETLAELFAGK